MRLPAVVLASLSACLLALLAAPSLAQEAQQKLPLERVVLFTSGVGYFQRDGAVQGDASVELRFSADDVNDLLKSLVLRDLDGGHVGDVTYGSKEPLERALASFPIDLSGNPSLAQILEQTRGEQVSVAVPTLVKGTIVGVEMHTVPVGKDRSAQAPFLNLLTSDGLKSFALSSVQSVQFARAELQDELRRALEVIAGSHDTKKKSVVLHFDGKGQRRVSAAYIVQTPVWKTTYRLGLGDKPFLQGWAIVENTTDEDWNGVQLTLVSGRPISFVMDLYGPLYIKRPEIALQLYRSLKPQRYTQAIGEELERKAEKANDAARRGRAARPAGAAKDEKGLLSLGQGVTAAATASEVGELFQYAIEKPVTLPRQKSALLPIAQGPVEGEKLSIYNESTNRAHPLNGFRLKNTTGLFLREGPVTVFDGGSYAGDAILPDTAPGTERLLSYALDLDVEVDPVAKSRPEEVTGARIAKGTLVITRELFRTKTYRVQNRAAADRTVLIEHPYSPDWTLVAPAKPSEKARDVYRFSLKVPAGEEKSLTVEEKRFVDQSVQLSNANLDFISVYFRAASVSDAVKKALGKVVSLRRDLDSTRAQLEKNQRRTQDIFKDQQRIRENMARLSHDSDLYARYVKELSDQETELGKLYDEAQGLHASLAQKQQALDDYLSSLTVEGTEPH